MLAADARARASGGRLVVIAGPPRIHRLFTLTGIDRRLDIAIDPLGGQIGERRREVKEELRAP